MRRAIKNIFNTLSPNLSRNLRNARLRNILNNRPQIASDGTKFWGVQQYENYEPNVLKVLSNLIAQSNIFVNVGANHGIYCLKFAKMVDKVYAFEALPDNLNLIYKNIKQNELSTKIAVFPVAAGSNENLATFYGASSGGSLLKGWNQQVDDGMTVPVFTLDFLLDFKLNGTRPLFLIDVEGAEYEVIKGAKRIIETITDAVFCVEIPCREFMPNEVFNPNFMDIFEYFYSSGFLAYEIDDNGSMAKMEMGQIQSYFHSQRYEGVMAVFSRNPL